MAMFPAMGGGGILEALGLLQPQPVQQQLRQPAFFSPDNENANMGLASALLADSGWSTTPQNFSSTLGRGLGAYQQGALVDQRLGAQKAEQDQWVTLAKQLGLEGVPPAAVPGLVTKMLEAQYAPDRQPAGIQEYEYAKKQGYKGTFYDWMNEKSRAAPYYQVVPTSKGYQRFNARTGQLESVPGNPALPLAADPAVQGDVARAKAAGGIEGEAEGERAKRALNAPEREELYKLADDLIDKSTGSGAGALTDKTAAFFGKSTAGAEAADRLKIIGGTLTLKVPRMEGPQSNLDQELYREVSGQLGDPTIPPERKKAALKTLRDLDKKYSHLNKEGGDGKFKVRRKIK